MHRPARRRGPALVIVAALLGVIGGASLGLANGAGVGSTVAAPARGAAAPSSSRPAAAAPAAASASRASGGEPAEQRLSAPPRQLDRGVKAGRFRQKEPGDSGERSHGKAKEKGKQAHDG
jgi:hypothetical protein